MMRIAWIRAHQVLDSRGNPTLEVIAAIDNNGNSYFGNFMVPSGASTGTHEALELRDNDEKFHGKGVSKAIHNVNEIIAPKLIGMTPEQRTVDEALLELDGTPQKSKLGANAILGVSVAVAKATANALNIPFYKYVGGVSGELLPVPMLNVINGGKHADNDLDFQEFMIVPMGFDSFSDAIRAASEIYHTLKKLLRERNLNVNVGDEGGFAPNLKSQREALDLLIEAIEKSGYKPGEQVWLALDSAASEFYHDGKYRVEGKELTPDELIKYYEGWIKEYPIISIEDPLAEDDWDSWVTFTKEFGDKIQIVGDDLYVTNPERLEKGIQLKASNAILIKLNQIGTLTETLDTIDLARRHGMNYVISHRSGETEDTTISHLAVGTGSGLIKTGAPARGERTAKYNELLRIEQSGVRRYAGREILKKYIRPLQKV